MIIVHLPDYYTAEAAGRSKALHASVCLECGSVAHRTLTDREQDVIAQLIDGRSDAEIGQRLGITPATAKKHVQRLLRLIGARSRTHLVSIALGASEPDPSLLRYRDDNP